MRRLLRAKGADRESGAETTDSARVFSTLQWAISAYLQTSWTMLRKAQLRGKPTFSNLAEPVRNHL